MHTRLTNHQQLELARKRLREASTTLTATLAETRQELAETKAELERRRAQERIDEQFAERARSGKAGRDLRRIQELVDRGQVTWDDVVRGRGEEWMTVAVRRSLTPLKAAFERGALSAAEPGAKGQADDGYFDDPLANSRPERR